MLSSTLIPPAASQKRLCYAFGPFVLHPFRRTLLRERSKVRIGPKAFDILCALVEHCGRDLGREELEKSVWGNVIVDERTVRVHMAALRKALGDQVAAPRYILTTPGVGYRFISEVREFTEAETVAGAPANGSATPDELDEVAGSGEVEAVRQIGRGSSAAPCGDPAVTAQPPSRTLRFMPAVAVGVLVALIVASLWLALYGLATLTFCITAATLFFGYQYMKDMPLSRLAVSVLALAAMAFVPSGWTLPRTAVVNMTTLTPAVAYPFVTGLRFIPQFVLIFGCWVVLGLRNDAGFLQRPILGRSYTLLGIIFQLMTVTGVVAGFDDYRIWRAGLPERWLILIGYVIVFAVNLWLWVSARGFLRKDSIHSYTALFSKCVIAYLVLVVPAVFIDQEYNQVNRSYLDKRRPDAYVATNPDAIREFRARTGRGFRTGIGEDLASMLNDPEFEHAVRTQKFYKQDFDEPFQVLGRAVMYGYKREPRSPQGEPTFVIIRFPEELAVALRFQFVGEEE